MKLRVSEAQLDWTRESQELSDVEQLDVQRAVMLSMYQSLILQSFCQLGIHIGGKRLTIHIDALGCS